MARVTTAWAVLLICAPWTSGCLERELEPLNPCLVSGVVAEVAVQKIDKVDLLFVVDDSNSMRQEQVALEREFPRLIRTLTSGDRDGDGERDFAPAKDLHLGVVSTDLGLPGVTPVGTCQGLGDDGVMQHAPAPGRAECAASYPPFLTYRADLHDPRRVADDFSCIAALGTDGCGFEQPLEAALKALWPAQDHDPETGEPLAENRIRFLTDPEGFGGQGHGDGRNAGFLRTDESQGLSVLAVIVVTDEEDCSSWTTAHWVPKELLPEGDPLREQDMNVRCFHNKENLYGIERYVNGLRALRPGQEDLVVFGAIAGVPERLVNAQARQGVDFSVEAEREAYYARILGDPSMQEVIDPGRTPEQGDNLVPSCITDNGLAYPPRRIVEVAREFGENAVVQSICQDDFGPAMGAIIDKISGLLGSVCPPRKLVRNAAGMVRCDVQWALPQIAVSVETPTSCAERDYLEPVDGDARRCRVTQLPVQEQAVLARDGVSEGWYYDDFSPELADLCTQGEPQRIAFSTAASPPSGVEVHVSCLDERQSLTVERTDVVPGIEHPMPGSPCDQATVAGQEVRGDAACEVPLSAPTEAHPDAVDRSMFCHPERNLCVQGCQSDADCPAAWVCDDRPETLAATAGGARPNGQPICVNPTCGG